MKRVRIVPVAEIDRFPGMTLIARSGTIAALLGESFEERSRNAFGSDEEFEHAVAIGRADLHTFQTTAAATRFAAEKIEALNAQARRIDEALRGSAAIPPQAATTDPSEVIPINKFRA